MLLSVIIPCYNAEKFLRSAIRSVTDQQFYDYEIILIDDGSEDSTPEICREYAEEYDYIRVISNSHKGLASARNAGLREARGEWIIWLDADDLLTPGSIRYMMDIQRHYDADIVQGDTLRFSDESDKIAEYRDYDHSRCVIKKFGGEEAAEKSLFQHIEKGGSESFGVNNSACGKLIRKSLYEGVEFPKGKIYEDLAVFAEMVMKAGIYVLSSRPVYLYRRNAVSITSVFNMKRLDVLEITAGIEDKLRRVNPRLLPAARDRRFAANYNMFLLLNSSLKDLRKKEKLSEDQEKIYKENINSTSSYIKAHAREVLFHRSTRMKNRLGALLALIFPSRFISAVFCR